jgi:hypothetical protein
MDPEAPWWWQTTAETCKSQYIEYSSGANLCIVLVISTTSFPIFIGSSFGISEDCEHKISTEETYVYNHYIVTRNADQNSNTVWKHQFFFTDNVAKFMDLGMKVVSQKELRPAFTKQLSAY